jgi:hypothetical protein
VAAAGAAALAGALPAGAAAALVALKAAAFYALEPSRHRLRLVAGPLRGLATCHLAASALGAAGFLADAWLGPAGALAAEVFERALFFRSARPWGMPGR